MGKNRKALKLSGEMQVRLACILGQVATGTVAAYTEFDDLAPDEWRDLKRDANHGRKMRRVSDRASDEQLVAEERRVEEELRLSGQNLKQIEKCRRIGLAFTPALSPFTVRDRLLRIRQRGTK